jgi:hypothetical protein
VKCTLVALAIVLASAAAHADDDPWATGVSDTAQDRANALFGEGNQLFAQLAHAPALEKYRAAIALWDHPMIRFNMAVTLVRLDRMLEAAEELEHALRYGEKPFTPELYQQALDYQNLVGKQLGYIEVTSEQPGTQVSLDGKPWFVAPGTKRVRVTAGEHLIVAEREDHMTVSRPLVVTGGATVQRTVSLVPIERAMIVEYRHPRWMPWATTGSGAVFALAGLGVWLKGKSDLDAFQKDFLRACPTGCEAGLGMHPELAAAERRALLEGKIGVSLMLGGSAVAIGGAVWMLVNKPMRRLPNLEVTPSESGVAASARWRF